MTEAGQLTAKQRAFVREYLIDLNATKAAIRAGYSPRCAFIIGHENLRKPHIQCEISKATESRNRRLDATSDNVVNELAKLAFSDIRKVVGWDAIGVMLLDNEVVAPSDSAAVAVLHGGGGRLKVKMHDKRVALLALARHLGMM